MNNDDSVEQSEVECFVVTSMRSGRWRWFFAPSFQQTYMKSMQAHENRCTTWWR